MTCVTRLDVLTLDLHICINLTRVDEQVMEAAVIAVPHAKWTERPLLVVVPAPQSNLSRDDMLSFLQVHSMNR